MRHKYSNKRAPSQIAEAPESNVVQIQGLRIPTHLRRESGDEETFIPFATATGFLTMINNVNSRWGAGSHAFTQRQLTLIREAGFDPAITTADLSAYYNGVAKLVFIHRFLTNVLWLQDNLHINTAIPIASFIPTIINGRMLVFYKNLSRILQTTPFPKKWVEMIDKSFGVTQLSDNPNSPIRMFMPSDGFTDYENPPTADDLVVIYHAEMDTFFSDATNVLIAQILTHEGFDFTARKSGPIGFNNSVVNSWINQPFFDGVTYEPTFTVSEEIPIMVRREVDIYTLPIIASDTSSTTGRTVWAQNSNVNAIVYENDGTISDPRLDQEDFTQYGAIWESSVALGGAPYPSVTRMYTTGRSVQGILADYMFM